MMPPGEAVSLSVQDLAAQRSKRLRRVLAGAGGAVDHTPYATLLGDHATPLDEALAATLG
jgi:hypothetical protein